VVDVEQDDGNDGLCEDEVADYNDERRKDASGSREACQFQLFLDVCPAVALCTQPAKLEQRAYTRIVGARSVFSRGGQIKGMRTKVTQLGPGSDPQWRCGGESGAQPRLKS